MQGFVVWSLGCDVDDCIKVRLRVKRIFFCESPSSGIAGWRGGWIERIGSEGARFALLPAGPVPERWNGGSVLIEPPKGQRLIGRDRIFFAFYVLTVILLTMDTTKPITINAIPDINPSCLFCIKPIL